MSTRHRGRMQGPPVTRATPAPAGGVVIETFVPWKIVRRGVRKRIVTPLGEPEAFTVGADTATASEDTPLLRALGLAHHWQRLIGRPCEIHRLSAWTDLRHGWHKSRLCRHAALLPECRARQGTGIQRHHGHGQQSGRQAHLGDGP